MKRLWHNLRYHVGISLEGLRKTTKTSGRMSPGRELYPIPPEHEAGRSVDTSCCFTTLLSLTSTVVVLFFDSDHRHNLSNAT
jgi:hypothetical protein